ncbi:hypothetical protein SAY86_017730 [Trapa natans]|uniref:DC1 domain-containing protein n=1 Tax=Trapa natans TaxID=22666 RepID=A0AAN7R7P8_TRANT|nr:hypothetical protein SAY86_017730 [Trapa natans]
MELFKHFIHHHALRPFKAREAGEISYSRTCSSCRGDLTAGSAYRCSKPRCDFFLHGSCFSLPPQLHHVSHPSHPLKLLSTPPYPGKDFICNACGETSSAYTYHCSDCTYDLHVACAHLPHSVIRQDHPHPLNLHFPGLAHENENENTDDKIRCCSVCHGSVADQCWAYACEKCSFSTHLGCATEAADGQPEQSDESNTSHESEEGVGADARRVGNGGASDHFASLQPAQYNLQVPQFQNHMSFPNPQFMNELASSQNHLQMPQFQDPTSYSNPQFTNEFARSQNHLHMPQFQSPAGYQYPQLTNELSSSQNHLHMPQFQKPTSYPNPQFRNEIANSQNHLQTPQFQYHASYLNAYIMKEAAESVNRLV